MIESNDKLLRPFRSAVAIEAALALGRDRTPWRHGVTVALTFTFPRPAGHYGTGRNEGILRRSAPATKTTKPDLDKLVRSVLDSLTGVAFVDDSQVDMLTAVKRFGSAGTLILLEFADAPESERLKLILGGVDSAVRDEAETGQL